MTAITYQPQRHNLTPLVLIVLVMAAAAALLGVHAVQKHGPDAWTVRQCPNQPTQIWLKLNSDRVHCIYDLGNGQYGDQIVVLDEQTGLWREITSFIRQEGSLGEIERKLVLEAVKIWPK